VTWREAAACLDRGDDLTWFPGAGQGRGRPTHPGAAEVAAKSVCKHECPVVLECAWYGLGMTEGIWGGLNRNESTRLRKALRKPTADLFEVEYEKIAKRGIFA